MKPVDQMTRRCPRLGGPVDFRYCRQQPQQEHPCWKILDCWWERFDVASVLRKQLSAEKFSQVVQQRQTPKPKVQSLIELIQEAQNRNKA